MEEKGIKMCKYANTGVVKVSTLEQFNIIKKVMNSKNEKDTQLNINIKQTKYNANLWKISNK